MNIRVASWGRREGGREGGGEGEGWRGREREEGIEGER